MIHFIMKIAINARFLSAAKLEGLGRFAYETSKWIVENHPEHEYLFIFDRAYDPNLIFSERIQPIIVAPQARHPFRIGDVIIYADYNMASDTIFSKDDAKFYDSFYVVDPYNKFNPRMFKRNIRFHPGDLYNRNDHNLTLSRLVNLGVYKFVKARFEEVDTVPDRRLNAYYYLSPNNRYSAKAQISALTKSNNSTGTDLTLSIKNRNAFRSAEQLTLSGFIGLETQIAGQQNVG
ncbi:MAG: hypothetical protein EOO00_11290, partial [Chitinophagaceae bacterium]